MKKINLIAILALCGAAFEIPISAMSFAKNSAKAAATITGYGIVAIPIVVIIIHKRILESDTAELYKNLSDLAHTRCNSEQIKTLKDEIERVDRINCKTCLENEAEKLLDVTQNTNSDGTKMIAATIASKCTAKITEKPFSLPFMPRSCETCKPSTEKHLA